LGVLDLEGGKQTARTGKKGGLRVDLKQRERAIFLQKVTPGVAESNKEEKNARHPQASDSIKMRSSFKTAKKEGEYNGQETSKIGCNIQTPTVSVSLEGKKTGGKAGKKQKGPLYKNEKSQTRGENWGWGNGLGITGSEYTSEGNK